MGLLWFKYEKYINSGECLGRISAPRRLGGSHTVIHLGAGEAISSKWDESCP